MSGRKLDLKTDNLWKLLCNMSLPGILGIMVISINTFVDALYIGNMIGRQALAGISLYFPISIISTSVTVLICSGSASILSRAIGSGDNETQMKLVNTAFTMAVLASIPLMCAGLFFSETLIRLMGGYDSVLKYGSTYYKHCSMGLFFAVCGLVLNALIRSEGKMKRAMLYTAISVLLNIALTPLLIRVFKWGIEGAAWASNVSMIVYFLFSFLYFIYGKTSFKTGKFRLELNRSLVTKILSIGLSSFLLQSGNFIRQTFIFKSVAHYGTESDVAYLGAVFRIFSLSVTPVFGILQALQPIIGINYGAGNYLRCAQSVKVFRIGSAIFLSLIWIPLLCFPEYILATMLPEGTFSPTDVNNFRIILLTMPLLPIASSGIIFFQAIGKGTTSGMLSIGRELILFIPLILFFPDLFGLNGIYYGIAIENACYILIVLFFTLYEFNKLKAKPYALLT